MSGLAQQIRYLRREIEHRRKVYPRLVSAGRMTSDFADGEIDKMKAVLETLEELLPLPDQQKLI